MGVRSKARLNFITPGYSNLTISQINACFWVLITQQQE